MYVDSKILIRFLFPKGVVNGERPLKVPFHYTNVKGLSATN
jgi:hypothetical protein